MSEGKVQDEVVSCLNQITSLMARAGQIEGIVDKIVVAMILVLAIRAIYPFQLPAFILLATTSLLASYGWWRLKRHLLAQIILEGREISKGCEGVVKNGYFVSTICDNFIKLNLSDAEPLTIKIGYRCAPRFIRGFIALSEEAGFPIYPLALINQIEFELHASICAGSRFVSGKALATLRHVSIDEMIAKHPEGMEPEVLCHNLAIAIERMVQKIAREFDLTTIARLPEMLEKIGLELEHWPYDVEFSDVMILYATKPAPSA